MIDTNSLDIAGQGPNPGCLTLICVLSVIFHGLTDTCPCEKFQQLHAAGLTLSVPEEEGMASCKFSADWIQAAKLPPLPGHPYLNKNFVSGSQRFLYPVTPETSGKSPGSLYQGLSIRDSLCPLYVAGGNTIQRISP